MASLPHRSIFEPYPRNVRLNDAISPIELSSDQAARALTSSLAVQKPELFALLFESPKKAEGQSDNQSGDPANGQAALQTEGTVDNQTAVIADHFRLHPLDMLECAVAVSETRRMPTAAATAAAQSVVKLLANLPPARLRDALTRLLVCREVDFALEWLHLSGILALLLPELEATVDFSQEAGRKHKDVWEHTKQVVRQAVPRPMVRWAALLHDIGKVPTRTFTSEGVHFHGHSEVGARMFDPIARRFAFDRPDREKIRFLILHHLRANQYDRGWTDSAIRRFEREMAAHLVDLLDLSRADITSRRPGRRSDLLSQISELSRRIDTLREEDAKEPPLPTGVGNEMMARFKLPPSRLIGDLKRLLDSAIEAGTIEPYRESSYYCDWLEVEGHIPKVAE